MGPILDIILINPTPVSWAFKRWQMHEILWLGSTAVAADRLLSLQSSRGDEQEMIVLVNRRIPVSSKDIGR